MLTSYRGTIFPDSAGYPAARNRREATVHITPPNVLLATVVQTGIPNGGGAMWITTIAVPLSKHLVQSPANLAEDRRRPPGRELRLFSHEDDHLTDSSGDRTRCASSKRGNSICSLFSTYPRARIVRATRKSDTAQQNYIFRVGCASALHRRRRHHFYAHETRYRILQFFYALRIVMIRLVQVWTRSCSLI